MKKPTATVKPKILKVRGGFEIRWWKPGTRTIAGLVPVKSNKQALELQRQLGLGLSGADAGRAALVPARRRLVKILDHVVAGGHARSANLSPERRREIAAKASAARWGKKAEGPGVTIVETPA